MIDKNKLDERREKRGIIQLTYFEGNDDKENLDYLAKILNFLNTENIDYDLDPPKKYNGWEDIGNGVSKLKETNN